MSTEPGPIGFRYAAVAGGPGDWPIVTIGHSTHPVEAFTALLQRHGVRLLADVRQLPGLAAGPLDQSP